MTLQEVIDRVQAVMMEEGDPEIAHVDEDQLVHDVIRELAPTSELAAALLPLLDSKRDRWYS